MRDMPQTKDVQAYVLSFGTLSTITMFFVESNGSLKGFPTRLTQHIFSTQKHIVRYKLFVGRNLVGRETKTPIYL